MAEKSKKQQDDTGSKLLPNSTATAALVMESWGAKLFPDMDMQVLVDEVGNRAKAISEGDSTQTLEAMLANQAMALQTMFLSLSRRAAIQEQARFTELYCRLALKAQSQCRQTIEAIAEIKHPRQVHIISNKGQQQVNLTHGNPQTPENKLLEVSHGNHLDTRAQSQAVPSNPRMEALESKHRAAH